MSKRVVVSVINDLNTDQRVHKTCSFIQNQGYEVLLVGRLKRDSLPMEHRSYKTYRMHMYFEKGPFFYAFFNLRLFFFLLFKRTHILVANDLDTLLPNYLVSKLRKKKLIYDSHEYFTEVPELIQRPKVQSIWLKIEQWIFPKLQYVSTVNNSIAEKYQSKYGVKLKVIRNVSPLFHPKDIPSKEQLGLPLHKKLLIMQGAGLNVDRGVEEAIRMMPLLKNAALLIVGDGDVIPAMKTLVAQNGWADLVYFFGKRPYREMMHYTYHADLGLSFDQPTNPNYLFSLPNKVFDYIHTNTPILCSDVIEVRRIVETYQIGKVITDFTLPALAQTVQLVLENDSELEQWKCNCMQAASCENWEKEVEQLADFYPKL